MTLNPLNGGQNFGSSSRALGAFDQRAPYGILIHLRVDFLKMNESQFRAENPGPINSLG